MGRHKKRVMVGNLQRSGLSAFDHLERAALFPEHRATELEKALTAISRELSAAGTALLRPHSAGGSLQITYAGEKARALRRRLDPYREAPLGDVGAALSGNPRLVPGLELVCLPLKPKTSHAGGLWVVWVGAGTGPFLPDGAVERFRSALESFLEVEDKERLYLRNPANPLDRDLARALREGDEQALPALLAFTRTVGGADIAYWGAVHDDVVDVGWQLGAEDRGFGFQLPLGQGVGGRAFAQDSPLLVPDYRNCPYRYPGVSDVTDSEKVRSVLAVPVHGADQRRGAVLYAVRRAVDAFDPAERIMLRRLARNIEPVPGLGPPPKQFSVPGRDRLRESRSGLREVMLNADQVTDVEAWLEDLVRGPAILVDDRGRPYAARNNDRLEQLLAAPGGQEPPWAVPLEEPATKTARGRLYLWPSVDLPPGGWPDFLEDTAAACNIVIDRAEESHERLHRRRAQWLRGVEGGSAEPGLRREGNRLGLPADRGEVWAVAWSGRRLGSAGQREQTRLRMLAEDVALDALGSPLIFLEEGLAALLLKDLGQTSPSGVRDELLRVLGSGPVWLVHGGFYGSFEELGAALLQTVRAARRVRDEAGERYVLEVGDGGLDALLENPRLSNDLLSFADNLLAPITAYDERNGTQLTVTLCLTLTSGSTQEVARRLYVHANTVRYRSRRAEEILGRDLAVPKERAAATLAAFVWLQRRSVPSGPTNGLPVAEAAGARLK